MRFMMLMYPGPQAETGAMPTNEAIAAMMKYNEELVNAGVMLAGEGLHPTAKGARVRFKDGEPTVTDGPFTETKELLGGFWMIKVKDRAEALEWLRKIPGSNEEMVELRQVYEMTDFSPEVQAQEADLVKKIETQLAANNNASI